MSNELVKMVVDAIKKLKQPLNEEFKDNLADVIAPNLSGSERFAPLQKFLKAHSIQLSDIPQGSGDAHAPVGLSDPAPVFNASTVDTYDKAAHRQGRNQEESEEAWDDANAEPDEWTKEYWKERKTSKENAIQKMRDLWMQGLKDE